MIISFFNVLNNSLVRYWPLAVTSVAEGYTSIKRIEEFLLKTESHHRHENHHQQQEKIKQQYVDSRDNGVDVKATIDGMNNEILLKQTGMDTEDVIIMDNVTAKWGGMGNGGNGLYNVNSRFKRGQLYGIVGGIGAGKSTLLQVLLNELGVVEGNLTINGKISYASQEPFLFEASVRENITFMGEYDEKRLVLI